MGKSRQVDVEAAPGIADDAPRGDLAQVSRLRAAVDAISFASHVKALAAVKRAKAMEEAGEGPGAGEEERDDSHLATSWGTGRSLINAAVSGGVLALAFQIPRGGSLSVSLLIVVSAFLLYVTMMMLYRTSLHYGTSSYTGTARKAWGPRAARAVAISLGLGQFGILVGYANVLRDTIPWVIQFNAFACVDADPQCQLPWYASSWFIITLLMVFFIAPISLRSDPDMFAKISFTTFLHFLLFLVLVLWGAFQYWPSNGVPAVYTEVEALAANLSVSEKVFPTEAKAFVASTESWLVIAVLAFAMEATTCGMPILHGTRMPKGATMETKMSITARIVGFSMLAVAVYYLMIMLGCYIAFGNNVRDNCLASFPASDALAQAVRCTYAFELGTSVPIYVYSMRRDLTAALLDVDGDQSQMDRIERENAVRTALVTLFLLASSTVLGVLGSLSTILSYTGACVTAFNVYCFPAALYMSSGLRGWHFYAAPAFLLFGLGTFGIGLFSQIRLDFAL